MRVRRVFGIGILFGGGVVAFGCGGDTKDEDRGAGARSSGGASMSGGDAGAPEPGRGGRATGGAGTGGRTSTGGAGATATGGVSAGTGGQSASGGAGGTGGAPAEDVECVIAVRLDECCPEPQAMSQSQLDADGCLTEYPPALSQEELVERCPEADPAACALVDCAAPEPPSRVVAADATGACGFVNECESDSDCTIALDLDQCCPCPAPFPNTVIEQELCLVPIAASFRPSECMACTGVVCSPCPSLDGTPVCEPAGDAPTRCAQAAARP